MARGGGSSSGGGCGGLIAILIVIGAIVGAAISLAAIVDPFGWMPSVHAIWADCDHDCALAQRFPGFWWHVVINLAYTVIAGVLVVGFARMVPEFRRTQLTRYDSAEAMEEFRHVSAGLRGAVKLLAGLAAIPLLVSIL